MGIKKKLRNPKLLILAATVIISLFYTFIPSIQDWIYSNMTLVQNWERETKMPGSVLIVLGILVIGSFVYLIYDALKKSDTERLEEKLNEIVELLKSKRDEENVKHEKSDSKSE